MNCPTCKSDEMIVTQGRGPHAAAVRCSKCNRWLRWAKKAEVTGHSSEKDIQNEILAWLGTRSWCRVWRNNTGIARTLDGKRVVSFGVKGAADITGIMNDGRRLEVEIKAFRRGQTAEQRSFQGMIEAFGGIYIVAMDRRDVIRELGLRGYNIDGTSDLGEGEVGSMGDRDWNPSNTTRREGADT